jgi:hypothetical protein
MTAKTSIRKYTGGVRPAGAFTPGKWDFHVRAFSTCCAFNDGRAAVHDRVKEAYHHAEFCSSQWSGLNPKTGWISKRTH